MNAPLLSVADLCVHYAGMPQPALAGANLALDPGQRLAVIGESGSGKSTLARAIAGLLPPGARQAGQVAWPALAAPPRKGADIGFVFQDPGASLDPVLTIGEQVAEAARARSGTSWAEAYARAEALLARVHLPDPALLLRAFPHQLSGGQRQRIAIAAAIAAGPRLLIADEATSALDMAVQAEIVALIGELVAADGMALIMITHDIALAGLLAETMLVMRDGRIVEAGAKADVLGRPQTDYTKYLLGAHIGLDAPIMIGSRP